MRELLKRAGLVKPTLEEELAEINRRYETPDDDEPTMEDPNLVELEVFQFRDSAGSTRTEVYLADSGVHLEPLGSGFRTTGYPSPLAQNYALTAIGARLFMHRYRAIRIATNSLRRAKKNSDRVKVRV